MNEFLRLGRNLYLIQINVILTSTSLRCSRVLIAWWVFDSSKNVNHFALMVAFGGIFDISSRIIFGHWGDQFNRKNILFWCNLCSAAVLAIMTALYFSGIYHLALIGASLAILGIAAGIREPINTSILPSLVSKADLEVAVRTRGLISSVTMFSGPILATALLSWTKLSIGLLINLIILIVTLVINRSLTYKHHTETTVHARSMREWYLNIKFGLKLVFLIKTEFYIATLVLLTNFVFSSMFTILMPALIFSHHQTAVWLLIFSEGAFAVGLFLGSSAIVRALNSRLNRHGTVKAGFYGMGLSLFSIGASILLFDGNVVALAICFSLLFTSCGVFFNIISTNTTAIRLLATPKSYQNRMTASVSFLSGAMVPLGNVFSGYLVDGIRAQGTLMFAGAFICIATFCLIGLSWIRDVYVLSDEKLSNIYSTKYPEVWPQL